MRGAAILLLLAASPATAQPAACLSDPEAEALVQVALPEIIRQAGTTCAARLPATSVLRRRASPLLGRYDAAAERAWPAARAALVKLSDPFADTLLDSRYARPVLLSLAVPLIVGRIAAKDCVTIARLTEQLEPLPPANAAAVVVTTLRYLRTARPPAGGSNALATLPLCS